jgi:hypothetical protein
MQFRWAAGVRFVDLRPPTTTPVSLLYVDSSKAWNPGYPGGVPLWSPIHALEEPCSQSEGPAKCTPPSGNFPIPSRGFASLVGMTPETKLRAASYARTSSAQQHTCQTQLALCRNLIDDRGWKLTHQLRDDALKGKNPDRSGYQRLLDLVKEKRIDVLVTWKLDRAFRRLKEASSTQAPQINAAGA